MQARVGDGGGDAENEVARGGIVGVNGEDWQKDRHGWKRRDLIFI
jgi:hypothetical protein